MVKKKKVKTTENRQEATSKKIEKLAARLEKEWSNLYGKLYVGTAYSLENDPKYVIRAYTNDETIAAKLPKKVEGFTVEVSGIPRAGG